MSYTPLFFTPINPARFRREARSPSLSKSEHKFVFLFLSVVTFAVFVVLIVYLLVRL